MKIYRQEGASGFFKARKSRGSNVLTPEVLVRIQFFLTEGRTVRSISEEMDLKADTVNKAIRDGRLCRIGSDLEKKSPLLD